MTTIDVLPVSFGFDPEGYNRLRFWAEMFTDAQETRIRSANRMSHAPGDFSDELALALANEHRLRLILRRQFRRTVPAALVEWEKSTTGVGIDLLARLVGHLGHPRIAIPHHWEGKGSDRVLVPDEPFERSVSQLWSYCGHGDPERRKFKDMTADDAARLGSPRCKMVLHLIAEGAIKEPGRSIQDLLSALDPGHALAAPHALSAGVEPSLHDGHRWHDTQSGAAVVQPFSASDHSPLDPHRTPVAGGSSDTATPATAVTQPRHGPPVWPYRLVYEQRRVATVNRVHDGPCVRCGPSGRPAPDGSPWSDKHKHADALRIVGKEILKDIWRVCELP